MPLLTLVLCGYGYEMLIARPVLMYQGSPQALSTFNINTWFRVLRNNGFIVGYSDFRGNPLWVEYALTPVPDNAPSLKRPSHFQTDWRGLNRVSHDDYTKSGFDRGHNAPNHAMSMLYGKYAQANSFDDKYQSTAPKVKSTNLAAFGRNGAFIVCEKLW